MNIAELQKAFPNASRSTLLRNLGEGDRDALAVLKGKPAKSKKRLRQSAKPIMNKLETKFLEHLRWKFVGRLILAQAIKFRLCNGVWYCPDFYLPGEVGRSTAFEVKGPQQIQDDASVKIKMAAAQYPRVDWFLVWEESGKWAEQEVLP